MSKRPSLGASLLETRLQAAAAAVESDDVDTLVTALRESFREYKRQKTRPFRIQVERAAAFLRTSGALPELAARPGSSDSDAAADSQPRPAQPLDLNASVTRMYTASQPAAAAATATRPAADAADAVAAEAEPAGPEAAAAPAASASMPAAAPEAAKPTKRRVAPGKRPRGVSAAAVDGPRKSSAVAPKKVTYADLGGIDGILADVRQLIEFPLRHPEVYAWLGVPPPRGVLLYGPPGCGKTALANAIANECGVPFFRVSAPEIVSGMSGESEAKLRVLFADAAAAAPAIVFLDEVDAITPKRETAQREMERRIVAQLLTCMDDLGGAPVDTPAASEGGAAPPPRHVVVIGATNRPDALDGALRRAGRFDREISLGVPSAEARAAILRVLTRPLRLAESLDISAIAHATPGYVGADLAALASEAAAAAVARAFAAYAAARPAPPPPNGAAPPQAAPDARAMDVDAQPPAGGPPEATATARAAAAPFSAAELAGLAITMADFEAAVAKVQPSIRREGFSTKPDVTWADVGSLDEVREELDYAISQPIRHPGRYAALGLAAAAGVLLFGPPGCGKTLVAKAVAAESGANFISIKGPELLNKYVGESERAVRALFGRARAAAPCVLFFDELDALAPKRGSEASASTERVVNQLLTELDGTADRAGVYIVAASNRPDILDPALLRPGRLDKSLYVPLPDATGRGRILAACARRAPLAHDVRVHDIAARPQCEGLSGADMASLLREAAVASLKESVREEAAGAPAAAPCIHSRHFEDALRSIRPSVSVKDGRAYARLRDKLHAPRNSAAVAREAGAGLEAADPDADAVDDAAPTLAS